MDSLWQDLLYGARLLRREPGFTAVVVVTLALGIGANTAIFSAATALLVRPLPIPDADRVVFGLSMREGVDPFGTSPLDYAAFRDSVPTLATMGAAAGTYFNLVGHDEPERVTAATVDAGYLLTLQVPPIVGRSFTADDDRPGAPAIALLGYDLWQRRFGGESSIIGRSITTDAGVWTIVGVMPRGFDMPAHAEIWAPMRLDPETLPMERRMGHGWDLVARLRRGATLEQASAEISTVARQLEQTYPQYRRGWAYKLVPLRQELLADIGGRNERSVVVLMIAVGVLLMICCANVANLLLVRGVAREREIAVRLALGASPRRLLRFMITESLLLAAIGGLAGVLVATWLTPILQTFSPIRVGALGAFLTDFRIDARVLVFALIVSVATGVLFGSAPALRATRRNVASSLKRRDQHGGGDQAGRRWLGAFVVGELALSTALLVAGGLVVRSFERLQNVDLGFDPDRALTMRMALAPTKFPDAPSRRAFVERTLDRVRALPGIRAAGMTTNLPLDDLSYDAVFSVEGRPPADPADVPITAHRLVSPGYLQALGARLVKGRLIDEHDRTDTLPVVVVTEEFARQAFQADDPIGRRVRRIGGQTDSPWLTVIGVVADVKEDQFNFRINRPAWYLPYLQGDSATPIDLLVRTDGDPSTFSHAVREAIKSVDPTQAIGDVMPLQDQVSRVSVTDRFSALLGGALAGTGLFLAICGLYGVIAYSVSQRTGEFGLRMALGARPVDLLRLVVGQGVLLTIAGIAVGLAAARVLTIMLSATLYEIGPGDPATFGLAAVGLAGVALVACYVPARRAASIDPITAIRND